MDVKNQQYKVKAICKNCSFENYAWCPKGETAEKYIKQAKCENCGCATLYKAHFQ